MAALTARSGGVLYVDLFLAHVFLDDLLVLDDVLADPAACTSLQPALLLVPLITLT